MSTVLEEKMPMIRNYLVERYGQISESAVDSVAQGLKTAISMGIASSQDKIETLARQGLGGPDTTQSMLGPLIGTKISEAAGVIAVEQVFQGQLKELQKAQNAELTSFAKTVFGQDGVLKSLQEKGIIINGVMNQAEKGMIINGAMNQAEKGIWVQSEKGIVGPEYRILNEMEETLFRNLKLQQDLQQFNIPVKA